MLVDMLIEGHHKLSHHEHHAFQKACRKRIAKGKEAELIRRRMASALGRHINNITMTEGGTIEE